MAMSIIWDGSVGVDPNTGGIGFVMMVALAFSL